MSGTASRRVLSVLSVRPSPMPPTTTIYECTAPALSF